MKLSPHFFLLAALLLLSPLVSAQDDWTKDADIEDAELVIEKQKVLTMPKAIRQYSKMSLIPRQTTKTEVNYQLKMMDFNVPDIEPNIRTLKMQQEQLDKLYGNYVKAGFGNYLTPYLEGYFGSKRNKDFGYGLTLKHLSSLNGPVDGKNSGSSYSKVLGYGSYLMRYSTLSADLGYERQAVHYYGYADSLSEDQIEADSIRQIYSVISASAKLEGKAGSKRSPLSYTGGIDFYTLSDELFELSETNLTFSAGGEYALSKETGFSASLSATLGGYQYDSTEYNRGIVRASGGYHLLRDGLELKLGAKIAYNLDSTTNLSRFGVYPDILARYQLIENKLSVFGKVEGDLQEQTFRSLIRENPFLSRDTLRHLHNIADISVGVQIAPTEKIGIHLEGGYNLVKNFYYFQNNAFDSSQFDLVQDAGTVGILNVTAEISANVANFRTSLRTSFYNYGTDEVAEPLHRPTSETNLLVRYNFREKIFFNLEAFHLAGLQARDSGGNLLELDGIFDLNFKADYLFSDVFSAFLSTKNLLGKNYERYYRYPVQGINIMAGVTYAF